MNAESVVMLHLFNRVRDIGYAPKWNGPKGARRKAFFLVRQSHIVGRTADNSLGIWIKFAGSQWPESAVRSYPLEHPSAFDDLLSDLKKSLVSYYDE